MQPPSSSQPVAAPAARCHVPRCEAPPKHAPVLRITLVGSEHVSRVRLPALLCAEHRDGFAEGFLTPARRATIEATLRSGGRSPPDWAKTRVEFPLR